MSHPSWPAARRPARSSFSKIFFVAVAIGSSAVGALGCGTKPAPPAAQPSRSLAAEDYYPLSPGWKWAYDLEREGDRVLAVYSVLERTSEKVVVQAGDDRLTYAVTAAGIAQHDAGSAGDFLLKNPPALGAEWPVFGGRAKVAAVNQQVSVPAGDYAGCLVVETLRSDPVRLSRTTYAPGVGPIAIEVQVQDQGRFVTTLRASLRGVTKPGEDPLADNR